MTRSFKIFIYLILQDFLQPMNISITFGRCLVRCLTHEKLKKSQKKNL